MKTAIDERQKFLNEQMAVLATLDNIKNLLVEDLRKAGQEMEATKLEKEWQELG